MKARLIVPVLLSVAMPITSYSAPADSLADCIAVQVDGLDDDVSPVPTVASLVKDACREEIKSYALSYADDGKISEDWKGRYQEAQINAEKRIEARIRKAR